MRWKDLKAAARSRRQSHRGFTSPAGDWLRRHGEGPLALIRHGACVLLSRRPGILRPRLVQLECCVGSGQAWAKRRALVWVGPVWQSGSLAVVRSCGRVLYGVVVQSSRTVVHFCFDRVLRFNLPDPGPPNDANPLARSLAVDLVVVAGPSSLSSPSSHRSTTPSSCLRSSRLVTIIVCSVLSPPPPPPLLFRPSSLPSPLSFTRLPSTRPCLTAFCVISSVAHGNNHIPHAETIKETTTKAFTHHHLASIISPSPSPSPPPRPPKLTRPSDSSQNRSEKRIRQTRSKLFDYLFPFDQSHPTHDFQTGVRDCLTIDFLDNLTLWQPRLAARGVIKSIIRQAHSSSSERLLTWLRASSRHNTINVPLIVFFYSTVQLSPST
jgi:hypothetical protein